MFCSPETRDFVMNFFTRRRALCADTRTQVGMTRGWVPEWMTLDDWIMFGLLCGIAVGMAMGLWLNLPNPQPTVTRFFTIPAHINRIALLSMPSILLVCIVLVERRRYERIGTCWMF